MTVYYSNCQAELPLQAAPVAVFPALDSFLTLKEEWNGTQSLFGAQASHFSHDWLWHEVKEESSMELLQRRPRTGVTFLFPPPAYWHVKLNNLLHVMMWPRRRQTAHTLSPLPWLDTWIIYQTITLFPPTTNRRWAQTSVKLQRRHEEPTAPSHNTATDSEDQIGLRPARQQTELVRIWTLCKSL